MHNPCRPSVSTKDKKTLLLRGRVFGDFICLLNEKLFFVVIATHGQLYYRSRDFQFIVILVLWKVFLSWENSHKHVLCNFCSSHGRYTCKLVHEVFVQRLTMS